MFKKSEKILECFIQIIMRKFTEELENRLKTEWKKETEQKLEAKRETKEEMKKKIIKEMNPIAHKVSGSEMEYIAEKFNIAVRNERVNSKFMRIMIDLFQNDYKNPDYKKSRESVRKFQLLVNKLFTNLADLDSSFDTESYIYHSLEMLNEILDNQQIMKNSEIKYMFYTKHATNTLFSLIIKEYNYTERASKVRQFAYVLLIKIMKVSTPDARRSFRTWTYTNDNEARLFKRIIRICKQFSTFFINEDLTFIIGADLKETDFREILLSFEWLTILCDNNHHWQEN